MQIHNGTLTNTSVSIEIGNNLCAYVNSARGRALIEAECTEDIVKAVFAVWGDKPTVTEPTYPTPPAPQPSGRRGFRSSSSIRRGPSRRWWFC